MILLNGPATQMLPDVARARLAPHRDARQGRNPRAAL